MLATGVPARGDGGSEAQPQRCAAEGGCRRWTGWTSRGCKRLSEGTFLVFGGGALPYDALLRATAGCLHSDLPFLTTLSTKQRTHAGRAFRYVHASTSLLGTQASWMISLTIQANATPPNCQPPRAPMKNVIAPCAPVLRQNADLFFKWSTCTHIHVETSILCS